MKTLDNKKILKGQQTVAFKFSLYYRCFMLKSYLHGDFKKQVFLNTNVLILSN